MMLENSDGVSVELDFAYAVAQAKNREDLRITAERFAATYDFGLWVYALAEPDLALTNYPASLVSMYIENRWRCGCDPLVQAIHQRHCSMSWDLDSLPRRAMDPVQRRILEYRRDLGARSGVSAPAYAWAGNAFEYAIVSFSRDRPLSETAKRHHEPRVQAVASYFLSVAQDIFLGSGSLPAKEPMALTQRERDCLSWVAAGKSSWEIGRLLCISEATVNFHVGNAAARLGVRGRACAVARAIRQGLISPA